MGQTGYGQGSGYNEGGMGGYGRDPNTSSSYGRDPGAMHYGQGHQGMGHTQGQGFGESGGQYGQQRGGQSGQSGQQGRGHRGKGPSGWQHSDDRIKDSICEMLHDDDDIDASRIDVTVKNGEVTLTGTVGDRHMKRAAEDLVERCRGVKEVQNNIRVQSDQNASRGNNGQQSNSMTSGSVSKNETEQSAHSKMEDSKKPRA